MALTQELLQANSELQGLTQEQVNAIIQLSTNDENSVLGTRIGEIYRQMDTTIATATGIQRNGDEKTYKYLERAMQETTTKTNGLTSQIAELTKEKSRLEKVIAEGGADAETKKQLAQAQKDLTAVQKQFAEVKNELDTTKANHAKEIFGIHVDAEIAQALVGVKFNDNISESLKNLAISSASAKIKGYNPQFIDNGKGGKQLAFIDENGLTKNNPNNGLQPYTAKELLIEELKTYNVIAEGSNGGGGTNPNPNNPTIVTGARTQVEAQALIEKQLLAKGMTKTSQEYFDEFDKLWKEGNYASLPLN